MKYLISLLILIASQLSAQPCPGLVVEKISLERVGHTAVANMYNLHVYAHTTNGTTPSLKVYAKCGEWYYNYWLCVNVPHSFETEDTLCFFGERFELYGEWYAGPNCIGQRCSMSPVGLTTPIGDITQLEVSVKKIGNTLTFAPDVKEVEIINGTGTTVFRQAVKGDIMLNLPKGIYFVRTRGNRFNVSKILL